MVPFRPLYQFGWTVPKFIIFLKSRQVCDVHDIPEFIQGESECLGRSRRSIRNEIQLDVGLLTRACPPSHFRQTSALNVFLRFSKMFPGGKLSPFFGVATTA